VLVIVGIERHVIDEALEYWEVKEGHSVVVDVNVELDIVEYYVGKNVEHIVMQDLVLGTAVELKMVDHYY
jgi:hypothetical protein